MSYKNIYFLFFILLFTSCGVKQVSTDHLTLMSDPSELNGRYINKSGNKYLSNVLLKIYDSNRDKSIDLVDIYSPSKDTLVVSYVDASGDYNEFKFKGKFKGNYFEYYLERNRLYAPPFLMRHWITKRRIGKNNEGKLEIHEYQNNWGALFIICGGSSNTDSVTFEPYSKDTKLWSTNINNKWGYKDRNDSIVITPQYDYAQAFKNGLAKVFLNEKWGYIDSINQIVIPIVYDLIIPSKDGLFRVVKDSKWGLIDLKNNIIMPFEYNKIDDFGNNMSNDSLFLKLAKVYKNNKVGFINTNGEEIIPVLYDEINSAFSYIDRPMKYYKTRIDHKYGFTTGHGVFCEAIFDQAEGFGYGRKNISDKIGLYAKVKYKGKSYVLGENGIIYPYRTEILSFINPDDAILNVDFSSGIKVGK